MYWKRVLKPQMNKLNVAINLYDDTLGSIHEVNFTDKVSIYTCGITPYDSSHLGHSATFVYFDLLSRLLRSFGLEVCLARNVTDLDDPLFERVRQTGQDIEKLIHENVTQLDTDLELLNCLPADFEPYSSQFVGHIIDAIDKLIRKGNAYTVDGWTYFDISTRNSFPEFEILKKMNHDDLLKIASERGANPNDVRTRNDLDFVLWKPSLDDEPSFEAPFGNGRPGWHIECSVMAHDILGETIDIHGGGDDLIFPHHACEVAQSESLSGKKFVRHFMHTAPISYHGTKMSKSLGNLKYAADVINSYGAGPTRLLILRHHYRSGFEYCDDLAVQAQEDFGKISKFIDTLIETKPSHLFVQVQELLANDLDAPGAIQVILKAAEDGHNPQDIKASLELLGLT